MTEPQNNETDKPQRSRPFGSFLLFLTVLVVVLVAFGGANLTAPAKLSQDEFEWFLHTGQIEQMEFSGSSEVKGLRAPDPGSETQDPIPFTASFTSITERESAYQQIKAVESHIPISEAQLVAAVDDDLFRPELYRHLTATRTHLVNEGAGDEETTFGTEVTSQEDVLVVGGTARPAMEWSMGSVHGLPEHSGKAWFRVDRHEDLGGLKAHLIAAGASAEDLTYNLTAGTRHSPAEPGLGLILLSWGPWILFFAVIMYFMRQMRNQGSGAGVMSFGRSRAQLYTKENHTNVTFDDVAGAQEAKDEVQEVVAFLKNPGSFKEIGGRIPRGVLLVGPPGCGKTLLSKAIAGEAEVPFYSISGSDFVEMFVGVGASRVRDLFKQARESSPCIIFLDEIDAVGRRRGSGMGGGHDEREQTLNAILVEMDGFGTDEGIIVVAATNRPDVLDPALLRPGRFDRQVTIELPDREGREGIIAVHIAKVKTDEDVEVKSLAKSTPGYSGADLAAIVNEAAIMAVLEKLDMVHMRHLEEATAKVRYGRKKSNQKIEAEDLEITAYHEAGHTILAAKIEAVDMPHKVTIVPRGRALGATMMLPEKESYHTQKLRLIGQLAMAFGGRVAEEIFVGDISAGASDDIRRATEIARAMVTELGMSERVGPINYADRQGSDFLGTELMSNRWHSEETAHVIDKEIERILRDAYDLARKMIHNDRAAVERLAKGLLMHETLDEKEIILLIEGTTPEDLRPDPVVETEATETALNIDKTETQGDSDEGFDDLPGGAELSPA